VNFLQHQAAGFDSGPIRIKWRQSGGYQSI
jgi:hypothetical protein